MNPALETLLLPFSANDGLPVPTRTLFLGAEAHPALQDWPELTGWQPQRSLAEAWDKMGLPRVEEPPEGRWPVVLLLPGKSRDEIVSSFAMARDKLEPGGTLVAALANLSGAGRFEKDLSRATGKVVSIQKNKCRVFHAQEDGTWNETLFSEWRDTGIRSTIPGTAFTTQAGLFSHGHVDPGSRLLVEHLPTDLRGSVADLGAGWGYLSAEVLRLAPKIERLSLFESDSRALACARLNLAGHDGKITYHWHDVTTGLPASYDVILMNPPFHTGRATDVDLGRAFLKRGSAALKRGGRLYLVANRQLPYEALLKAEGLTWNRLAEDKTYKVLAIEKF